MPLSVHLESTLSFRLCSYLINHIYTSLGCHSTCNLVWSSQLSQTTSGFPFELHSSRSVWLLVHPETLANLSLDLHTW